MRSSLLDQAFSEEEREFLWELLDQGCEEGKEAFASYDNMVPLVETVSDMDSHIAMVARQRRKNAFYELLRECLGGDPTND